MTESGPLFPEAEVSECQEFPEFQDRVFRRDLIYPWEKQFRELDEQELIHKTFLDLLAQVPGVKVILFLTQASGYPVTAAIVSKHLVGSFVERVFNIEGEDIHVVDLNFHYRLTLEANWEGQRRSYDATLVWLSQGDP